MSFKDGYRKYNEQITPDKAFLDSLAEDMSKAKRSRISIKRTRAVMSVCAACLCLAVGATVIASGILSREGNIIVSGNEANASSAEESSEITGMFGASEKWYDSSMSSEEIYSAFIARLSDAQSLQKLYKSAASSFTDEDLIETSYAEELAKSIRTAEFCAELPDGEAEVCYMAVFSDGEIIKFGIYDSGYVVIKGTEGCYKK